MLCRFLTSQTLLWCVSQCASKSVNVWASSASQFLTHSPRSSKCAMTSTIGLGTVYMCTYTHPLLPNTPKHNYFCITYRYHSHSVDNDFYHLYRFFGVLGTCSPWYNNHKLYSIVSGCYTHFYLLVCANVRPWGTWLVSHNTICHNSRLRVYIWCYTVEFLTYTL